MGCCGLLTDPPKKGSGRTKAGRGCQRTREAGSGGPVSFRWEGSAGAGGGGVKDEGEGLQSTARRRRVGRGVSAFLNRRGEKRVFSNPHPLIC